MWSMTQVSTNEWLGIKAVSGKQMNVSTAYTTNLVCKFKNPCFECEVKWERNLSKKRDPLDSVRITE